MWQREWMMQKQNTPSTNYNTPWRLLSFLTLPSLLFPHPHHCHSGSSSCGKRIWKSFHSTRGRMSNSYPRPSKWWPSVPNTSLPTASSLDNDKRELSSQFHLSLAGWDKLKTKKRAWSFHDVITHHKGGGAGWSMWQAGMGEGLNSVFTFRTNLYFHRIRMCAKLDWSSQMTNSGILAFLFHHSPIWTVIC